MVANLDAASALDVGVIGCVLLDPTTFAEHLCILQQVGAAQAARDLMIDADGSSVGLPQPSQVNTPLMVARALAAILTPLEKP